MNSYFAPWAFLDRWERDVRLEIDAAGNLSNVRPGSARDGATLLAGPVLAGMPNAHSHAFQRALAGRTERAGPAGDSFWTWREAMYGFLQALDPDTFEAIATLAYVEMVKAGYTSVAEFHYLHHGPDGVPYARPSEMADRVVAAAQAAGIGLTLLPVLYRFSDFGRKPPAAHQARFVNTLESFASLWLALSDAYRDAPLVWVGIAPHSLRAVGDDDLRFVLALIDQRDPLLPIHIHASEQRGEVDACRAHYDTTPIDVIARSCELAARRWCLVHATHATDSEVRALIDAQTVVCLCPTTEANLGDGIFPAGDFWMTGGRFAIGSDSNVSIDVAEELRWLEYGQRLRLRERNIIHLPTVPSIGEYLYRAAAAGGAQALGQPVGAIASGLRADLVVLDSSEGEPPSTDVLLFKSGAWRVRDVMVCGRWIVRDGHHPQEAESRAKAARAVRALSLRERA